MSESKPLSEYKLEPDPNERACVTCKLHFNPYSMAPDGEQVVEPPVDYECLHCRSKVGAK